MIRIEVKGDGQYKIEKGEKNKSQTMSSNRESGKIFEGDMLFIDADVEIFIVEGLKDLKIYIERHDPG